MRKLLIAQALLLTVVVTTAQVQKQDQNRRHAEAAIIINGNALNDLCQDYKTEKVKGTLGAGCFMYIAGVTQTLIMNGDTEQKTMKSPCPGRHVTDDQITDVIVKWLDDHPEKRDLPAPFIVMTALGEAFPCN